MAAHMVCLSRLFITGAGAATEDSFCPLQVIPVGGVCPSCAQGLLWGDLVRHKQGCFQAVQEVGMFSFTGMCMDVLSFRSTVCHYH